LWPTRRLDHEVPPLEGLGPAVHRSSRATGRPQDAIAGSEWAPRGGTVDAVSNAPSFAPPAAMRTRDLPAHGVPLWRLRGPEWERVSHGLHAPAVFERSVPELARLTAPVLPRDSGFGHLTSAHLRGWWLPNELGDHVLLATTRSGVHVQRQGLYVRRSRYAEAETLDGIPLIAAAQTLVELARDLTLVDLVPMVDCALAAGTSRDEILAAIRPRARGAQTLRRAVGLADRRSESWWESVLRLMHVVAGMGPVECQVDVAGRNGVVARADLHLVGTDRYPECDGGEHRTRARHLADLRRDKAMHRTGAERYGYTTSEIAQQPHVVIDDAETARGYSHDPRRVARWWTVARGSSLTAYGRTRLARRLRRYRLAAER
jgi:hypothetical protein